MKKPIKQKEPSFARRFPWLLAGGIILTAGFLTVGVVAGVSKQRSRALETNRPTENLPVVKAATDSLKATQSAGVQTGQIRPLTQEEAQKLAAALKELANQSTDGLQSVRQPDGTVAMDLQGRFQNVAIARKNEDGTVSQSCVDNPASGAAFFGLDPKLVGVQTKSSHTASSASPADK